MLDHSQNLAPEDLLFLAKVADHAKRFEDCVAYMEALIKQDSRELALDERNLLSSAFKSIMSDKRASWRVLGALKHKYEQAQDTDNAALAGKSKGVVEKEIGEVAHRVAGLLDSYLIPNASSCESKVFYLKLKGDYFRYIAEFARSGDRHQVAEKASDAYIRAYDLAQNELLPTHPIRLSLALNYSVFNYDILGDRSRASDIARSAFDEAVAGLDNVTEESYKDSTMIISLLRDNLTLWANDMGED
jgi:14-3-3 protein epsilon